MRDIPIIFSAPMVRALLEGRKTMTRRLAWKPLVIVIETEGQPTEEIRDPSPWQRVQPGDRLWVRENVQAIERDDGTDGVGYPADDAWLPIQNTVDAADRWGALFNYRGRGKGRIGNPVPSIHMPRWASRLTLTVTAVRIEPLQAISDEDAAAEGIAPRAEAEPNGAAAYRFRELWDDLHGPDAWDANPEVVVISFDVRKGNIDA